MNEDRSEGLPSGMDRQADIYERGLMGVLPTVPTSLSRLERQARETLSPQAYDYVAGGAGSEDTMRANLAAFRRWRIVPRMLRDVSGRDLSVELFGVRLPAPVLCAPIGVQCIVHPDGELASAAAAASLKIPFVISTAATRTMEDIADATPDAARWYQLYWGKDFDLAASMAARAEKCGCSAIVITLDTPLLGWRDRDLEHAYLPFLLGQGLANYFADPVFRAALTLPPEEDPFGAVRHWASIYSNPALCWDDLAFLRKHTRLPLLLKGILHPDDAEEAVRRGMDGIIVSNHGGRQVDGAIGALDALPRIANQVRDRIPVLFDSGIRRGVDAFKAIALGAKAVLFGRPTMWGLAASGQAGVREVLQNFLAELDLAFALSGYNSVAEVDILALVKEEALLEE
jgi:isopentenyl diphosphate isomerase/L-lactate dehydrogenase-like FMN-dependent dehydrogenase